jgi:hypothetical protein
MQNVGGLFGSAWKRMNNPGILYRHIRSAIGSAARLARLLSGASVLKIM